MKLRTLATLALLAPLTLATPVGASTLAPLPQLNMLSNSAESTLIARSSWQEFSSSTGQFAVSMPGVPTEKTEKNRDGSFTFENNSDFYRVSYLELPAGASKLTSAEVKQLLDLAASKFADEAGVKLLDSKSITLAGYSGEEFHFSIHSNFKGTGQIYFTNKKLYFLLVVTPEPANEQNFLSSFRLLS